MSVAKRDRRRRVRAALLLGLAACSALGSALVAADYRAGASAASGPMRPVLVVAGGLDRGERLGQRLLDRATTLREVPELFAPPDAIGDPSVAVGATTLAPLPTGSYLTDSVLTSADSIDPLPRIPAGLRGVELEVAGPPGDLIAGRSGVRVDVVVAGEPNAGGRARAELVAEGVRLVALEPLPRREQFGEVAAREVSIATLAVKPRQALLLIEAENYAREVRLIRNR